MSYTLLKLLHLGSFIFWLGPALGAWLVLKKVEKDGINQTTAKVNKVFFTMIAVEHIAFISLLLSGLLMAMEYGWLDSQWLQQKLMIVGLIVIPLEIIDIVLGNWLVAKASTKLFNGDFLTQQEQRYVDFYHGPFTKLAIVIIPIAVLFIMYLAISKAPLL